MTLAPAGILLPVRSLPSYAVLLRAVWERGPTQAEALAEIRRRGIWLTPQQRRDAGLSDAP